MTRNSRLRVTPNFTTGTRSASSTTEATITMYLFVPAERSRRDRIVDWLRSRFTRRTTP